MKPGHDDYGRPIPFTPSTPRPEQPGPEVDRLASCAHIALDAFTAAGGAYAGDTTDEKLADFISAIRHLADRYAVPWSRVLNNAERLYRGDLGEGT